MTLNNSHLKQNTFIMKTKFVLSLLVLSSLFFSCKKEDAKEASTYDKLQGRWTMVSIVSNDHFGGVDHPGSEPIVAGDYAEFLADGTLNTKLGGITDVGDYGIVSESQIWIDSNTDIYDVRTLTSSSLVLYNKDVTSSTDYFETTVTLSR